MANKKKDKKQRHEEQEEEEEEEEKVMTTHKQKEKGKKKTKGQKKEKALPPPVMHEEEEEEEDEEDNESEQDLEEDDDDSHEEEEDTNIHTHTNPLLNPKQKERLKKEAAKYRDEIEGRGVVYLSSLPPFMKPAKVRHLLEKFAPITRLYLVEEDAALRRRRIKSGGNRKKKYTEGWIEFAEKAQAKQVAVHLNGSLVGGKKRNFYHDGRCLVVFVCVYLCVCYVEGLLG